MSTSNNTHGILPRSEVPPNNPPTKTTLTPEPELEPPTLSSVYILTQNEWSNNPLTQPRFEVQWSCPLDSHPKLNIIVQPPFDRTAVVRMQPASGYSEPNNDLLDLPARSFATVTRSHNTDLNSMLCTRVLEYSLERKLLLERYANRGLTHKAYLEGKRWKYTVEEWRTASDYPDMPFRSCKFSWKEPTGQAGGTETVDRYMCLEEMQYYDVGQNLDT